MSENIEQITLTYTILKDFLLSINEIISKKYNTNKTEKIKISKLETAINSYLEKKYVEFSYIKPLALLGESTQLEKIYQPLTIERSSITTPTSETTSFISMNFN